MMDLENSRIPMDYIAAFLMILIGFRDLFFGFDAFIIMLELMDIYTLDYFLRLILCCLGASVLLLTKHRSIVKTLMVSSILLTVLCLDSAFNSIVLIGEALDYNTVNFFMGTLMLLCGLMLLGNIIIYWTKASASLDGMLLSLAGILCLNIIGDLSSIRFGSDLGTIIVTWISQLPMYALIVLCIIMLCSKSVRVNTIIYDVMQSSEDVRKFATPMGVKVDRMQIQRIKDIADSGLSSDSYEVKLNSYYPMDYKLIFTKSDDRTHVHFCSLDDCTETGLARFNLKGIWMDSNDPETCDLIRLYDDDMFFIQLIVGDPYKKSEEKISIVEAFRG